MRAVSLLLALAACAPKDPAAIRREADVREAPKWESEAGRREVWRDIARWSIDNGVAGDALDMVRRLREAGEDSPELTVIQARALNAQGLHTEARLALDELLAKQPRNADAHRALGVVLADLGELDRAITALSRSLDLEADDVPTRNNLGFLLLAAGRCPEAVAELERCVTADGSKPRYRNNLAFALVCTGDSQRALQLFRSTATTEAEARYQVGLAYERLDSLVAARNHYEQSVRIDPQYQPALDALARLDEPTPPTPSPGDSP
jgi:Flp pilus assembly protein TadD